MVRSVWWMIPTLMIARRRTRRHVAKERVYIYIYIYRAAQRHVFLPRTSLESSPLKWATKKLSRTCAVGLMLFGTAATNYDNPGVCFLKKTELLTQLKWSVLVSARLNWGTINEYRHQCQGLDQTKEQLSLSVPSWTGLLVKTRNYIWSVSFAWHAIPQPVTFSLGKDSLDMV